MNYWKWWWNKNKYDIEIELYVVNIILFSVLVLTVGFVFFGGYIGMVIVTLGIIGILSLFIFVAWVYDKLHKSYKIYLEETKNLEEG